MVHGLRVVRDSIYETFSEALSKLQKRNSASQLTPEKLKVIRGILVIACAGGMAFLSHSLSQQSAIEYWNETHWVPSNVWSLTLTHYGLRKETRIEAHATLFKNAPEVFSEDSMVWMSLDGCAIYLNQSPYQEGPELWLCHKPPKRALWASLGSGIRAFEAIVGFFEANPRVATPPPKAILIDPKELRY